MDPVDYLFSLERLGIKFGLENITALSAALGNPQNSYRSVIIAGTNGKGSVAAMVDRALTAAGLRAARYTSPHLVHIEERFAVDGRPVSTEELRTVAGRVREVVQQLRSGGRVSTEPTFFEVTTAVAFEIFRRAGVDVAVLEVGMGGRFDATNVAAPLAAAITTIDFDHERFLGDTIAEIAFEKAGVIKPGMIVVSGETKPEAVDVIARACHDRGARLIDAREGVRSTATLREGQLLLDLETPTRRYGVVPLALRGRHQAGNAIVAVRMLEALGDLGIDVPAAAILSGLSETMWPCRLELITVDERRRVLIDAAHNPAGARALADYLAEAFPGRLPIVFAVMRDKEATGMLSALAPQASRFIFTAPATARAAPPAQLAHVAHDIVRGVPIEVVDDPFAALERAWSHGPLVVVAGSIFLAGEILPHLPLPVSR